ncbi:(R)-mandelonitrile lyase [Streptomyces griseoflavus]|uniref:Cupin domain-containing protein n=1 Tax=Streptomyces griseoflavus Tu4000 TaxID=467200 RepID=D9XLV4_9ACTN|nr:cupin domain-containing protein [Streptomyces griseoflavus]EFL43260.1 cupin domain-containing protein [Streptomyces griseoflavus Tu4000]
MGGVTEIVTQTPTVKALAERFTGDVYLSMIETPAGPARLAAALVRFTPGARTNWHSHANGQTLHITDGVGLVGTRDGDVVRVGAGQIVKCPPGEEHWHGGTDTTLMAHIAMVVGDAHGDGTTWLEPVTDEQYAAALARHRD